MHQSKLYPNDSLDIYFLAVEPIIEHTDPIALVCYESRFPFCISQCSRISCHFSKKKHRNSIF